jgi:probable rRNA maturation factor
MDYPPQRSVDFNNLYTNLSYEEAQLHTLITFLDDLKDFQIPPGDLSIVFMSDPELASIHDEFMEDPTTTDVITFIGDPDMNFAGEICTSIDHALSAAKEHNHSPQEEITLYIVHGWLHLADFDDIEESDRQQMRNAEKIIMDLLKKENLIPHFIIK